jgi:hypothetical protein
VSVDLNSEAKMRFRVISSPVTANQDLGSITSVVETPTILSRYLHSPQRLAATDPTNSLELGK